MINIKNIELIWTKLICDLDGDDIVLEVKFQKTNIEDYNNLLKHLNAFCAFPIEYIFEGKKNTLPLSIDDVFFDDDKSKEMKIDLGKMKLSNAFFEAGEIEFYTDSILNLNPQDVVNFFSFIEWIGMVMEKEVLIFVESYPSQSVAYDFEKKLYNIYIYSDFI